MLNMRIHPPAKINLFLHVVGRRADSYHLLESLFAPLQCCDEIQIEKSDILKVEVHGADIEDLNLRKVTDLLCQETGCDLTPHIILNKKIPIGAGLGGGTSDAAKVILALNELYQLNLTPQKLLDIAIKIGADVPFFLQEKAAFVSGIGEVVTPVKLDLQLNLLLVNPGIHISTPQAFKLGFSQFSPNIGAPTKETLIENIYTGRNDITHNACIIAPQLNRLLEDIQKSSECIVARMSGSGSTCFGLFHSITAAKNAQLQFKNNFWTHVEVLSI
jgi:4-diphosphocytidyl-2-C-methyl-D-erythritol kinase